MELLHITAYLTVYNIELEPLTLCCCTVWSTKTYIVKFQYAVIVQWIWARVNLNYMDWCLCYTGLGKRYEIAKANTYYEWNDVIWNTRISLTLTKQYISNFDAQVINQEISNSLLMWCILDILPNVRFRTKILRH